MDNPGTSFFNGSIGLQYSFRNYSLPDWSGLSLAQKVLSFELTRKDLLVPSIGFQINPVQISKAFKKKQEPSYGK
ncbi:MAG: hypothetical protein BWY70_01672 [Bacteroidetes bacterium ADurb.Bin408]|nr:MAG: hypothetical protein BWY70_01672 [Bacteroidetes bacterium ADurb.Bin408]